MPRRGGLVPARLNAPTDLDPGQDKPVPYEARFAWAHEVAIVACRAGSQRTA